MFVPVKRLIGDVEPFERLPGAEGLSLGMAARVAGGSLSLCTGADKPTHILMGPAGADGLYPAIPVLPTTLFETECADAVAADLLGSAVQIAADGLTVTTASGGAFTLCATENAAGGFVRGRFV